MKELSVEEKAKRYDDAKERMKDFLKEWENCGAVGEAMEKARNVFPELRESDDERIRKAISDILLIDSDEIREILDANNVLMQDIDVWLEKQGENANFRNKIQIGDKVTRNEDGVLVNLSQLNRVAKKQGEQKPQGKSALEAAKEEKVDNANKVEPKDYSSIDPHFFKPSWSEEDDYNLQCMIAKVTSDIQKGNVGRNNELIDWLKSLRPQSTWKPSDEQIKAIKWVMDGDNPENWSVVLKNLYQDLKKLK